MDEQDFRASLRHALDASAAPPSMSPAEALHAGRRAGRRRTLATGAAGAATLAALTAAGLVVASGGAGAQQQAGGPGPTGLPPGGAPIPGNPSAMPAPNGGVSGSATKPVWPTGPDGSPQGDRTAKAGVKADAAKALLAHVVTLVPAGYTVPDTAAPGAVTPPRYEQAQFENKVDGRDAWSYMASVEVRKGGAAGRLIVEVHEPGLITGAGPCDVAQGFWTKPAACTVVHTGTVDVAVATGGGDPTDSRIDKWSAYAYPDGTVVFVAQSRHGDFAPGDTGEQLTELPFDDGRLAALAVDEAFHIKA